MNYTNDALDAIFKPQSVAVIGASNKLTSWGFSIFHNILLGGFTETRRLYPVNPNSTHILGKKTYPKVSHIPDDIDLGIIAVKASVVPHVLEEMGDKGIRGVVIITSDFSETGGDGKTRELELVRIARKQNMRLVGPNGMGIYSAPVKLNALMSWISPIPGSISCISQSGNIGSVLLRKGLETGIGFRYYVSSGNEADLRVEEFLEYFAVDEGTKSIVIYLESIRNGKTFRNKAQRISQEKPVVVFKGGTTFAGSRAAKSHTGSLAGNQSIYEAAFHQTGLIQVSSVDDAWNLAVNMSIKPLPRGNNVGIISVGGGWAVIASDACEKEGLNIPPLEADIIKEIDTILPPYWPKNNPIDTVALFNPFAFKKLLNLMLSQQYIDGILLLGLGFYGYYPQYLSQSPFIPDEAVQQVERFADMEKDVVKTIIKAEQDYQKPILVVTLVPFLTETTKMFTERNHLLFSNPESAARCFALLLKYKQYLNQKSSFQKENSFHTGEK